MLPSQRFQVISSGFGLIKFLADKKQSNSLIQAKKSKDDSYEIESDKADFESSYERLILPFDNTRDGYVVTLKFHSNGRYLIEIWKGKSIFYHLLTYIYLVNGAEKNYYVSPFIFISIDRCFSPLRDNQQICV
jgi:hypothetical protein